MWPWSRFERLDRMANTLAEQLVESKHLAEIAAINLRTAERDLERLGHEHNVLQADFKHLVAQTAGRVPSRYGQLNPDVFERDPFAEDPKIPDTWLTDDGTLPDIEVTEDPIRGEGEDSVERGSGEPEGDEGTPV